MSSMKKQMGVLSSTTKILYSHIYSLLSYYLLIALFTCCPVAKSIHWPHQDHSWPIKHQRKKTLDFLPKKKRGNGGTSTRKDHLSLAHERSIFRTLLLRYHSVSLRTPWIHRNIPKTTFKTPNKKTKKKINTWAINWLGKKSDQKSLHNQTMPTRKFINLKKNSFLFSKVPRFSLFQEKANRGGAAKTLKIPHRHTTQPAELRQLKLGAGSSEIIPGGDQQRERGGGRLGAPETIVARSS